MPIPRPAGGRGSSRGSRISRDQDEDRRERAERDHDEALGDRRRQLEAELARNCQPEQKPARSRKRSFPRRARVPGDHRERRAGGVGTRAYQSVKAGDRQHEPGDPGQSAAERPRSRFAGRADEDLLVDLDERLLLGRREGLGRLHHRPNSCPIWFQITTARPTLTQSTATSTSQKPGGPRGSSPEPDPRGRGRLDPLAPVVPGIAVGFEQLLLDVLSLRQGPRAEFSRPRAFDAVRMMGG